MSARVPEVVLAFLCNYIRAEPLGGTTALGIFGARCVLYGEGPALIDLGVHFTVRDGKAASGGRVRVLMELPGLPQFVAFEAVVGGAGWDPARPDVAISVNLPGVPIEGPGEIVATLEMDSSPPLRHVLRTPVEVRPPR